MGLHVLVVPNQDRAGVPDPQWSGQRPRLSHGGGREEPEAGLGPSSSLSLIAKREASPDSHGKSRGHASPIVATGLHLSSGYRVCLERLPVLLQRRPRLADRARRNTTPPGHFEQPVTL